MVVTPVVPIEEIPIMGGFHLANRRRLLLELLIGCLCAAVGCGPGGGSQGPVTPEKAEQIRKVTSDYMKNTRKAREQAGGRGGPRGGL
jgi:hypothetical protein